MSLKSLQDYTFVSKYARYNEELKRRETWDEAVGRVKNMHFEKYPQDDVKDDIEWAFERVKEKRVLGSQRALQFGGKPVLKKNARLYNCCVSYCDRLRFFQESFWLLLCGCGVGFSVQKHHVEKIPSFSARKEESKLYVIPDSIEGWADALGVLLSSYFAGGDFPQYEGYNVEFNYSRIRPEGSKLNSSSGKAPGPKPLKNALEKIAELLNARIEDGQTKLRPIDAYDAVMHASDAVLSGGVRRSATICLFSPDDLEMATAKTGNWFNENPQRGRSNNSALLIRDETSYEQFESLIESVKEYGEPGFVWSDSTELMVNPCVEIGMWPVCEVTGESGWEFCNLCEINGKKVKSEEDFVIAAKAAAIIGTLQAGYNHFEYLGDVTDRIVKREALLGVSITGMMDSPDILFDAKLQRKIAKLVLKVNDEISEKIGINKCARATCVKPAGTTSCILGTASGIHAHHARRYIRRSQANYLEAPCSHFKTVNPNAVEKSVWSANGTDEVISFCIEVPKGAKIKNELDAVTLLEHVKLTQRNWVTAGTREELSTQPWLKHNVSNTITVRDGEWEEVSKFIFKNRRHFAGISLLPQSGDKDYPQAPFTAIYTPTELAKTYGDGMPMASGLVVDGLHAFDGNLWAACDEALGVTDLKKPSEEAYSDACESLGAPEDDRPQLVEFSYQLSLKEWEKKKDWCRRVQQFSDRYLEGDIKQTTYLMKDVHNWKLWCDLKREYKDVDYTLLFEESDETKLLQESACSGGSCTIEYA
jgi:ribonucleoside-diphosphate reductase alpha chain